MHPWKRCRLEANSPQVPKDSITRGVQVQPEIIEFSRSLCCSVAAGAEPPICPALETMSGFWRGYEKINSSQFAIDALVLMPVLFASRHGH